MSFTKRVVLLLLSVVTLGFGVGLSLKAGIGVGAWDAFSQSISQTIGMKVGTFSMMMNISCVVAQLVLLRKDFKPIQILQVGVAVLLGMTVNFVLYNILNTIEIVFYPLQLVALLVGTLICAFSVAMVMSLDIVSMPLEGLCAVIAERSKFSFGRIRQFVDIGCIVLVFLMTFILSSPMTVREGTIIGMLILGPLLDFFMKVIKPRVE